MVTTKRTFACWVSDAPCYVDDNDDNNPYRLTLYVTDSGVFMLAAEGNGCAGDILLMDIYGWDVGDINDKYGMLNLDQLRRDSVSLRRRGRVDDADWLVDWIGMADEARRNV